MTPDEAVEVMARAFAASSPCEMTRAEALAATRAAIRALHERGGLVVARMPGDTRTKGACANGYNAALAAVRAAAVAIAEPPAGTLSKEDAR